MVLGGEERHRAHVTQGVACRAADGVAARPLRVLIVDDSAPDAAAATRELFHAAAAFEACRVDDGPALRDALGDRWDVVLVDDDVPGLDAAEVIDAVRSTWPDVPCVALSRRAGEEPAIAAIKRGADEFVSKQAIGRLAPVIRREVDESAARRRAARAREALELAEGRLEALAAGLQDRLLAFDEGGRITRVSGRPLAVESLTPARPVGRELWAVLGEPALDSRIAEVLAGAAAVHAWSVGAPGEERWFQAHLSPVRVKDEVVGGVAIVRDVTELKTLHARVAMSDRMATIGSIAAGAAHDLCAPIASALASLEEAARLVRERGLDPGTAGAPLLQALEDARQACEQIRHVARDLRAFSRADDPPSREASADLGAVLESAARMAAHELRGRARLVRELGDVPPVRGSVPRLGQVFLNLIVNAAQAIAPGAPERNEVRLRARAAGGTVAVEIEDTGCGMTPEVQRRLFTPFFTTKPDGAGTGLGLTICHRIVRELGGEIGVASEPGRGTRVRVVLPAANGPAGHAGAAVAAAAGGEGRPRVLVVDDEESVHRAMRRLLGRTFDVACDQAGAALARLERGERFDLVLCDVSMPEMSGPELRRRVEALDPRQAVRVAFLTGGPFGREAGAHEGLPGAALVDKAAGPEEIRASVEATLRALERASGPA